MVNLEKISHILFFVVFLSTLSIAIAYLFANAFPNLPWWAENLTPLFAYGFFYKAFDKYAWQLPIFRLLGISTFPNLNGSWKGKITSTYSDNKTSKTEIDCRFEIQQTFSKIKVNGYFQKSESVSAVANFCETDGKVLLYFVYDNEPNSQKQGTMQKHRGTVRLKVLPGGKTLVGIYFNDIGNSGEISLKFVAKDFKGKI